MRRYWQRINLQPWCNEWLLKVFFNDLPIHHALFMFAFTQVRKSWKNTVSEEWENSNNQIHLDVQNCPRSKNHLRKKKTMNQMKNKIKKKSDSCKVEVQMDKQRAWFHPGSSQFIRPGINHQPKIYLMQGCQWFSHQERHKEQYNILEPFLFFLWEGARITIGTDWAFFGGPGAQDHELYRHRQIKVAITTT